MLYKITVGYQDFLLLKNDIYGFTDSISSILYNFGKVVLYVELSEENIIILKLKHKITSAAVKIDSQSQIKILE